MLQRHMLKTRMKRIADHDARALNRLADIEKSVEILSDEDLLDFADIFSKNPETPLAIIALAEMGRRNIHL